MENTLKNAKEYLKERGCNIDSNIIDWDKIALFLVGYADGCGKSVALIKPIVFNSYEFKKMRTDLGLKLRAVEEKTGISNAYLSQLETGKIKKPSLEVVNKLLNLYQNYQLENIKPPISGGVKIDLTKTLKWITTSP